ncbi:MAG: hypothetical protein AB4042_04310 [Leptolyngbyaceae cyanobacterium]
MTDLLLKTNHPTQHTVNLLQAAVQVMVERLEQSHQLTRKNLERFETKYNVSSEQFIQTLTAEDLDGQDLEYTEWQGEYLFLLEIEQDLAILNSLEYVAE